MNTRGNLNKTRGNRFGILFFVSFVSMTHAGEALMENSPICSSSTHLEYFLKEMISNNRQAIQTYLSTGHCEFLKQKIPISNFNYQRMTLKTGIPAIQIILPSGTRIWSAESFIVNE